MRRLCARSSVFALAIVLSLGIVGHASSRTGSSARPTSRFARFDTQLRQALADRSQERQRVIVRARPGAHGVLRETLRTRGASIVADHDSLNGMTAVLGADDLERLADDDNVLSVS